jgi:ATP-dependent helicase/nuclease subunit A
MHQLIRASAGSGKTWQLSGHFLRQLFEGAKPETILATTFTRKAAGEILGRVLMRLAEACERPAACAQLADAMKPLPVTQETAATVLRELTGQLHRLRVSTLDSFFQRIARSLTLELGLAPGWTIVDDHTDEVLRQQAVEVVLAEQETDAARQLMQMLAKGRSRRSVRALIDDAIEGYYEVFLQADAEAWNRIPQMKGLSAEHRQTCELELQGIELSGKQLPKKRQEDLQRFREEAWTEFLTKGVSGNVAKGKPKFGQQVIPAELVACYEPLVQHARAEILNQISHRNRAAWKLIARFDEAYRQLRRGTGFTRFNEVTRLLAQSSASVDGGRVSYRLDSILRHLLLDEFQDTSLDQWHVLRRLVEPIVEDSSDNRSTIFCVGDTKQAIYGWRGGVAEIMDEVQAAVPGISATEMDESRRSSPAVIETVNHVFSRLHLHSSLDDYGPACFEWSQKFPEHTTFNKELQGFAEFRTAPEFDNTDDSDTKSLYTVWVAQQIREIHHQSPGCTIGVLMRTNRGVAQLVHQLTALRLSASEEGGTPPTDSPAVLAVVSLLQLASHPGCMVSRYHVSQSPLGGLFGLSDWNDDKTAASVAAQIRRRLLDDGYGPALQWVADSIADWCTLRDKLRLQQIVAEGRRYDLAPSLNPADFVALLESSRFSRTAVAPIRVMTVHQSKGLEFDIVVAPQLTGPLMRAPAVATGGAHAAAPEDVCVWLDKDLRQLLPQRLQEAFRQTTSDAVRGSLCALYVTLTRAVHALHLLVPAETKGKNKTLAGILAAAFADELELDADSQIWSVGDSDWYKQPSVELPEMTSPLTTERDSGGRINLQAMPTGRRRGLTRRAPSQHVTNKRLFADESDIRPPSSAGGIDSRSRGTLIHALFDQIGWLDLTTLPSEKDLRKVLDHNDLQALATDDEKLALLDEFTRMLKQSATQEALSERAARARFAERVPQIAAGDISLRVETERPFVYRAEGVIVQGTIDRLVIAVDAGQPVAAEVIDFKTDRLRGDRSEWIAMKKSDYRSQLIDYREAVQRCFCVDATAVSVSLLLLEADTLAGL